MCAGLLGPGPGAYVLPPTCGYDRHDVSKYRNPQYSMAKTLPLIKKNVGPGPKYNIEEMTPYGRTSPPCYSLKSRAKPLTAFMTPSPVAYSPEKAPRTREPRPPAYSMKFRQKPLRQADTPGPNQYGLPSTLGPKVPDIHANGAFTMSPQHGLAPLVRSPGPAMYPDISPNLYKTKQPEYSAAKILKPIVNKCPGPGPAAYNPPVRGQCNKGFTFGHRSKLNPYICADDFIPCMNRE